MFPAWSGGHHGLTRRQHEITSRLDNYEVAGIEASTRLYRCPNIASKVSIVHADRNTPGFMRYCPSCRIRCSAGTWRSSENS